MNVRLATKEDIPCLIRLRFDFFSAEGWQISETQQEQLQQSLEAYYKTHLGLDFFAALTELPDIASTAFLVLYERPPNPFVPTGKTAMVFNVFTYEQHRRKGYALLAMQALLAIVRSKDASYVELTASHLGRPLYEKLGFIESMDQDTPRMKLVLK